MKQHTSEKDILKAQKILREKGSSIKVTGKYTIGMKTVLFKYQRENGLPVTGELDDVTWKKLKSENSLFKRLFGK